MSVDDVPAPVDLPLPFASGNGSPAILLVDDHEGVRHLCRRGLEAHDAKVVEASDGEAALSFIQGWSGPLDFVITDLQMPRINGHELAEVLSIFRPDLPVLAMTADPGQPDRRLPTLVKPFAINDLIETVRLMRSRAREMRAWAEERRARARQARQAAAEILTRHSVLQQRVNLVAMAHELQQLSMGKVMDIGAR
jgi:CheY-like chemotaxis protein